MAVHLRPRHKEGSLSRLIGPSLFIGLYPRKRECFGDSINESGEPWCVFLRSLVGHFFRANPLLKMLSQSVRPRLKDVGHILGRYITKIRSAVIPSAALSENQGLNIHSNENKTEPYSILCRASLYLSESK